MVGNCINILENLWMLGLLRLLSKYNSFSTFKEPYFAYPLLFFFNPFLISLETTTLPSLLNPITNPVAIRDLMGTSQCYPSLKSLSNKFRGMLCHCGSDNKYSRLDEKLEKKMIEVKRSSSGQSNFKSVDSIILRFPQFKARLKNIKGVFEQHDEDSNGIIDRGELKKCLEKLKLSLKEKEIDELFDFCDIDGSEGIQFNEFIVLLCLIYLLVIPSSSPDTIEKVGSPQLKATFDTIVDAFLFLDKNGDGKLNKKDMLKSLNESYPWEKSPAHVTNNRFEEMDWDKNGKVSFREFFFALIRWVGIDTDEEITESVEIDTNEEITDRE